MLKLRRATVAQASPHSGPEQELVIDLDGLRRPAVVDVGLLGVAQEGDEVIVNVQALDIRLGSGGFDIVHVNLTRGLEGEGLPAFDAMKLCYTGMQHGVLAVEHIDGGSPQWQEAGPWQQRAAPVGVLALHGQLPAVAFAYVQAMPGARLGYVQTEGGALPGGHCRVVQELRSSGLLSGHITAGQCFGGELEAITTAGALNHGFQRLGWDAALCGPGPGIVGTGSRLGHGGLAALDSAHVALALGHPTLAVARMSSSEGRSRHLGISHHTLTVLDLLLMPVTVALPAGMRSPVGRELRAGLRAIFGGGSASGEGAKVELPDVRRPARIARHDWRRAPVDLVGYARSGLPSRTMGRDITQDPLFFGAALAAGSVLAELSEQAEEQE